MTITLSMLAPAAPVVIALFGLIALAALDWVSGVVAALRQGVFTWALVDRQLVTTILPKLGGLALLAAAQAASQIPSLPSYITDVVAAAAGVTTTVTFAGAAAAFAATMLHDLAAKWAVILNIGAAAAATLVTPVGNVLTPIITHGGGTGTTGTNVTYTVPTLTVVPPYVTGSSVASGTTVVVNPQIVTPPQTPPPPPADEPPPPQQTPPPPPPAAPVA